MRGHDRRRAGPGQVTGGLPTWLAYTLNERAMMMLDRDCRVRDGPRRKERLA